MATIDDLTTATTDLLTAVNVSKATLNSSEANAAASAVNTASDRTQTGLDRTQTGLDRAKVAADLSSAVAVVTGGTADLVPFPGKIPLAGADGRIDPNWIRKLTNDIGRAGAQGFGVGICPSTLPAGMAEMAGSRDVASTNYGNYQFSDGSVMCWIPAFFYKVGTGANGLAVNITDVKNYATFENVAAANAAGYALHRAFYDGGVIKLGVFVDKYQASNSAGKASSIKNGAPLSSASTHNPFAGLTGAPANTYAGAFAAAKIRGADFFCSSRFIFAALALLSVAHGQASTTTTWCAWYDVTNNFPKGNNDNALKDSNDATVTYTTDGFQNCGLTGSGLPFAKTSHNGQDSGVVDLNGNMYEINPGLTCTAITKTITAATQANPCVLTIVAHGATTGALLRVASVVGMTQINDKIFTLTVVDADRVSLDAVDSTAFTAYTSGGSAIYGTFSVIKTSVAMKTLTGGTTLATDHWGATGIAANFDTFIPNFNTTYPNNGFAQKFGNGASQVLSEAVSGDGWARAGAGLPRAAGMSTSGTNTFGLDYYYQYITNEMCPIAGGYWVYGSAAGVWFLALGAVRGASGNNGGFRAALYL